MNEDFSKEYLERTANGEESMLLLRVGSTIDATMIQSLLFSENISSFCLNRNINSTFINNLSPIKVELYILKTDYSAAKEIIEHSALNYKGSIRLYALDSNEIAINSSKEDKSSGIIIDIDDVPQGGFLSFNGICTLRRYWFHLFILVLVIAFNYLYSYLYKFTPYALDLTETIICMAFFIVWNIHMLCLSIQRMRSVGKNPWKILIPIYGPITVKFIPSNKDQSNNKYLDYEIPGVKWLRIILLILAIFSSGLSSFRDSITDAIKGVSETISKQETVFENEDIKCKKYKTEEGTFFYYNIYRYDGVIIDTVVFSEKETLNLLKKKYQEIKKEEPEDYLDIYCNFIYENSSSNPYTDLYDEDGENIASFNSDEYESITAEVIEQYNAKMIRFWYFDFDEILESTTKE